MLAGRETGDVRDGVISAGQCENRALLNIQDWAHALVVALVVVTVLFSFLFKLVQVEGDSMLPTLQNGNRVMIQSLFYQPKDGDIVVITKPTIHHKPLIKRVIATEGQEVFINFDNGTVSVDGEVLDEPYVAALIAENRKGIYGFTYPVRVPEGCAFVLGDNRNNSSDSRDIGFVEYRYILGRVILRFFPFDKFGFFL